MTRETQETRKKAERLEAKAEVLLHRLRERLNNPATPEAERARIRAKIARAKAIAQEDLSNCRDGKGEA